MKQIFVKKFSKVLSDILKNYGKTFPEIFELTWLGYCRSKLVKVRLEHSCNLINNNSSHH